MEPFSLRLLHDDPRHLSLSLCLVLPPVRPVPVAVYKSGRRLYPPTTLHRMEQRGEGARWGTGDGGGQRSWREGLGATRSGSHCIRRNTDCNLRRIVAEIRDWNPWPCHEQDTFSRPFSISFRGFRIFFLFFFLQQTILDESFPRFFFGFWRFWRWADIANKFCSFYLLLILFFFFFLFVMARVEIFSQAFLLIG